MKKTTEYTMDTPISALPGIGPTRERAFLKLGISTVFDLLYHIPRSYENRGKVRTLTQGTDGCVSSFVLTVGTTPKSARLRKNMTITKCRAFDETGTVELVFFNQPYIKDTLICGAEYRFWGKLTYAQKHWQLVSPAVEKIVEGKPLPDFISRYSLCEGLSDTVIRRAVESVLQTVLPTVTDPLPEAIRQKYQLPTLRFSLQNVHDPESYESLTAALRRLVFEEMLCFSLGLKLSRNESKAISAPCFPRSDVSPLLSLLPYELTGAQKRVCNEIVADMSSASGGVCPAMNRILIGDVGCGKTICAAIAAYYAVKGGYQVALMAPTEILARQHYADLSSLFSRLNIRVSLLCGSTPAKERRAILEGLCSEDEALRIHIIIGTHALLTDTVSFARLGLVITDEQHRFGVNQRAALRQKNSNAHLLVMSATPIPRTLALALYGDLSISKIDELPPGRQRVDTFVVDEGYRQRLNGFIRRQVSAGGQVYIVCPSIEETTEEADTDSNSQIPLDRIDFRALAEEPPLKAAVAYTEHLKTEVFPDLRIAFLHGRMKTAEKDAIMSRFVAGDIDILVATTVIEVGVNVPNATLMVIENAERFGLSQLHQLRGRVGRGDRKSYCILVSDTQNPHSKERLQTMHTTYDGYAIAEKDLKMRGPGDFFATAYGSALRQSGGMALKFAQLCDDESLSRNAFSAADELLAADPTLSLAQNRLIEQAVSRMFSINKDTIS